MPGPADNATRAGQRWPARAEEAREASVILPRSRPGGENGSGSVATAALATSAALGLVLLLGAPLLGRHLYPDQDIPIGLALSDMTRGGWRPSTLVYPTAWSNLLRLVFSAWPGLAPSGSAASADLLALWCSDPWTLRLVPRVLAVVAGLASLLATFYLGHLVAGPAGAFLASVYAGTAPGFVREHAHGMLDAPAAAAAMWAIALAARHAGAPSAGRAALAGICCGLAVAFKYNLAPAALAVAAGVAAAGRSPVRMLGAALAGATGAVLATSPAVLLEPLRLVTELREFVPRQARLLDAAAGDGGNRFAVALVLGTGWPFVALAGAGAVAALRRRERALLPLACFALGYGLLLATAPLVLNRYVLPLVAPLAVLAARATAIAPSRAVRLLLGCVVLATALPETVGQVRLRLREDTRVEAARWIEAHVPDRVPLHLTSGTYAAPDIPCAALDPFVHVPGGLAAPLPAVCGQRRSLRPMVLRPGNAAQLASLFGGGIVITAEPPAPVFAALATPPQVIALLEAHAREIASFRPPSPPAGVIWEPFDQNYIPVRGAGALARPGPLLRLWALEDTAHGPRSRERAMIRDTARDSSSRSSALSGARARPRRAAALASSSRSVRR